MSAGSSRKSRFSSTGSYQWRLRCRALRRDIAGQPAQTRLSIHACPCGGNRTAIKNSLYLALAQGGVVFVPVKLLRIDAAVGCVAAIGKHLERALGLLRDVVSHGSKQVNLRDPAGEPCLIALGEPFAMEVKDDLRARVA
jgi:hypothetical protein